MANKLLSPDSTNAKLAKNLGYSEIRSYILYMAPASLNGLGVNLCPASTEGCRKACLYSAGRGAFTNVQEARIRKAKEFIEDTEGFITRLNKELSLLVKKHGKDTIAVRLNGTTDIAWETYIDMAKYPTIQFYDYTKIPSRAMKSIGSNWPSNYHLTFSQSEVNQAIAAKLAKEDVNIAVVFRKELPETYLGKPVIDGTKHDLRFLDAKGVVVGLLAKGKARKDCSGFVVG